MMANRLQEKERLFEQKMSESHQGAMELLAMTEQLAEKLKRQLAETRLLELQIRRKMLEVGKLGSEVGLTTKPAKIITKKLQARDWAKTPQEDERALNQAIKAVDYEIAQTRKLIRALEQIDRAA
jgi:hypothetical protein